VAPAIRHGTATGRVRIIGGAWRHRLIEFPSRPGLRPTPDRVRETVFNWLTPYLPGAACLDLFAGSGAFGFEALSRGASRVVLTDADPDAVEALQRNAARLGAEAAAIVAMDALSYLEDTAETFDIVFVDPPYTSNLLTACLAMLERRGRLRPGAWIYLEARKDEPFSLPPGWQRVRSKIAGQVGYHLARKTPPEEAA